MGASRGFAVVAVECRLCRVKRGRIVILIFVGMAALLAGGLYIVFGIYVPNHERARARIEIDRWEKRYEHARTCLVGDHPASSDLAQSLAIRELSQEVDRTACTKEVSELTRGDAVDTGIPDVERAWRDIDAAVSKVASAFASRLTPDEFRAKPMLDPLPPALDELTAAHRALRDAAGMDPPPTVGGAPLPEATLTPISLGTTKLASLTNWLRFSAGGIVAVARGDAKHVEVNAQLVLPVGQAPRVAPIQTDILQRSITDVTWGSTTSMTGTIVAGPMATDGTVTPAATLEAKPDTLPYVMFAIGKASDGTIAYANGDTAAPAVVIAHFTGTALEPQPPHPANSYAFSLDPPNRGLLAWSDDGALHAMIVGAGNPSPHVVDLGSGTAGQSCLTSHGAWVSGGSGQFVELADDPSQTPRPHVLLDHELVGCDATSVLLRNAGHRYAVCDQTCRNVELVAKPAALPALSGGKVIAIAVEQRVLAVWREKAGTVYFALPSPIRPRLVHASATVVDVIAESEAGLVIARATLP